MLTGFRVAGENQHHTHLIFVTIMCPSPSALSWILVPSSLLDSSFFFQGPSIIEPDHQALGLEFKKIGAHEISNLKFTKIVKLISFLMFAGY